MIIVCLEDDCVVLVEMLEANPGGWRCHSVQLQTSGPVHPQSTLSPPSCFPTSFSVDNPSDLPELAAFVLGSPPITQKEQTNNFTEKVDVLTFADKKVLSLQNKVIRTKTFILCNTYHLHLSSSVHNSHKASLTLQTCSALHLCTSPPPSCHMFQRPNPHPSVLHAIMDERFGDWIKGTIVE